jgi:hypothetical protein
MMAKGSYQSIDFLKSPSKIEAELTEIVKADIERKLAALKLALKTANAYSSKMLNPYASLG